MADAASVRQQIPTMVYTDAGSVGHDDANLELLSERRPLHGEGKAAKGHPLGLAALQIFVSARTPIQVFPPVRIRNSLSSSTSRIDDTFP